MIEELKKVLPGKVLNDEETLKRFSHDASLLEVRPEVVVTPENSEDVEGVVSFVAQNKKDNPSLSVTARSAGTCMAGGSLNNSIILDFTAKMQGILGLSESSVEVLPGTFYRDLEKETLAKDLLLPCYPASKNLAALGGMISNNCAGEKTLRYGKMENFVESLDVVFSDGKTYEVKPLSEKELQAKVSQNDFEGNIYKNLLELINKNESLIKSAKPKVSKNSAGYFLWNVWEAEKKIFDLTKLIVGSQGTLGIVTKAKLKLVPVRKQTKLFVIFLPNIDHVSELVNTILPFDPESIESYDDATMKLAVRFFPEMLKTMKAGFLKIMWNFIPEGWMMLMGGIPKLILLVEITENTMEEVDSKMKSLEKAVSKFKFKTHIVKSKDEAEKYWAIRRESFNLLRKHVGDKRTAPFVDDVIVDPKYLPEFLPKMRQILDDYKLIYTIAGHAGNGNFHIIPLMDMHDPRNAKVIMEVSEKIYDLVSEYKGSITAEHNDGIIRTPYLGKMYSPEVLELFQKTKDIFDPQNIFNPGKKVGTSLEYLRSHIVRE